MTRIPKPTNPRLSEVDPFEGIETAEETLDDANIERRATQGVGLLVFQMFALQILTLGVTVVLARILSVADYGIFAVALALQQASQALIELGVGAALIGREEMPTEHEQRAVTGFVLTGALAICAVVGACAFIVLPGLGVDGDLLKLAFVACLALPVAAFRTVPTVLLERQLRYGRVTALYTADTIAFNLAALGGVLAGMGGFALVMGVPAGALAGLIFALALQKCARGFTWDFKVIRPMIAFGSQVSARQGIVLARDLTFVSLIAVIGGQTAAGFFAMSQRVLGVPLSFSMALSRVGFPAMARSGTDDLRTKNATRSIAIAAAAIGLPLAICAGSADPLLDLLFGSRWTPAAEIVIPSAAGLLLMASSGAIISSLFLSLGNARVPMISSLIDSIVLCGTAVFLIQWNSTVGIGLAVILGAIAGVGVLLAKSERSVKKSIPPVLRALMIASAAAAAGFYSASPGGITGLVASAAAASVVWLVLTFIFSRGELNTLRDLAMKGLKRSAPTGESTEATGAS